MKGKLIVRSLKTNSIAVAKLRLLELNSDRFGTTLAGRPRCSVVGGSVLIAGLTNSIGEILPPASVHYPDALGPGLGLLYNYTPSSFEQDLIINVQLPAPASVLPGADESQVMIGVITAFLDQIRPRHSPVVVDLLPAKQRLGLGSWPTTTS